MPTRRRAGECSGSEVEHTAWIFTLGHGHSSQYLNFKDCLADDESLVFLGLGVTLPEGTPLSRMLPWPIRCRVHEVRQVSTALAAHPRWKALFIACENAGMLRFVRCHPSFLYTDLSPSLKRDLSPWYDHQSSRLDALQALRDHAKGRVLRACRGVFTMSSWAARGIYGVPLSRLHAVLPRANLRRWHWIDRTGRPGGRPVRILTVGRRFRLKGGELLLDWAERTPARNWELDIVTWPTELPAWVRAALGNDGFQEVGTPPA